MITIIKVRIKIIKGTDNSNNLLEVVTVTSIRILISPIKIIDLNLTN
jgi:hypothetical protein